MEGDASGEIKEFKDLDPSIQELINSAIEVRRNAYCPYSNFAVGAAIRVASGDIFTGCNVENASYSPTICAERVAVVKAISEGHKDIVACAVVAYKETTFVSPCGLCRQVLSEFADRDFPVYLAKPSPLRVFCTSIYKLLPLRFSSHN